MSRKGTFRVDVFMSHQTNDRDNQLVTIVASHLQDIGADVWYDRQNLAFGQEIMDEVQRQIYDRPIFLVIFSPEALKAKWVHDECSWAFERQRRDPARLILPITSAPLPTELGREWLFMEKFKLTRSGSCRTNRYGGRLHRRQDIDHPATKPAIARRRSWVQG
jgi:hypothetical protein